MVIKFIVQLNIFFYFLLLFIPARIFLISFKPSTVRCEPLSIKFAILDQSLKSKLLIPTLARDRAAGEGNRVLIKEWNYFVANV